MLGDKILLIQLQAKVFYLEDSKLKLWCLD